MATEAQIRVNLRNLRLIKFVPIRVNSWLITKIAHFESFMQNKPNLLNTQINVTSFYTVDYENKHLRSRFKNKAKTNPNKAN